MKSILIIVHYLYVYVMKLKKYLAATWKFIHPCSWLKELKGLAVQYATLTHLLHEAHRRFNQRGPEAIKTFQYSKESWQKSTLHSSFFPQKLKISCKFYIEKEE